MISVRTIANTASRRVRGFVSVLAVIFLLLIVVFVMSLTLGISGSQVVDAKQQNDSVAALLLAESGLERASKLYSNGTPCDASLLDAAPISLGRGSFQVIAPNPVIVSGLCQLRVTGTVGRVSRTVDAWLGGSGGGNIALDVGNVVASASSPITLNLTVGAGANRVLVVGIASNKGSGSISAISYAGTALNSFSPVSGAGTGGNPGVDMFYLVNPPSGTGTLSVTTLGTGQVVVGAQVFTGVNQTSPINASAFLAITSNTTTVSISVTTTVSNALLIDTLSADKDLTVRSPALAPTTAGQTKIWTLATANTITGGWSYLGPLATPQTATMGWSFGSPGQKSAIGVVALSPVGGTGVVRWVEVVQ